MSQKGLPINPLYRDMMEAKKVKAFCWHCYDIRVNFGVSSLTGFEVAVSRLSRLQVDDAIRSPHMMISSNKAIASIKV